MVALKRIKIEHSNEGLPSTALREMSLLMEVDHPGIIKLLEVLHGKDMLLLVFEFFNTDLKKFLELRGYPLHINQARDYL